MAVPRLILAPRIVATRKISLLALLLGIGSGLALAAVTLVAIGVPARALVDELVFYAYGPSAGLDRTLTRAIPLVLVGLAVAICLRIRFWNIGVEGQLWMGAMAASTIVIHEIGPPAIRLYLMAGAAALAGGLWCLLPAIAKLKLNAEELITTLLLNYVAFLLVQQLLFGPWSDPATNFPVSRAFQPGIERLGAVGFGRLHWGVLIALGAVLFCWWLVRISRAGMMMEAVASNPTAARLAGVPVARTVLMATLLSGALSGLAGFCLLAGQEHKLTLFIGRDYLFAAVLIAFLARATPLGVLVAGIGIAGLYTAGDSLKAFYQIPLSIIVTVQAILLLCIALFRFLPEYRLVPVRRAGAEARP